MDDSWDRYTWEDCIETYLSQEKSLEKLKQESPEVYEDYVRRSSTSWIERNRTMANLIEQLRKDSEVPELRRTISHDTLRLWHPDFENLEVHITAVESDDIWIGLGGYEQLEVPLAQAVVTVKYYLEKARFLSSVFEFEKDETGDVEHVLEKLPLEWMLPAALNRITWEFHHLHRYKDEFDKRGSLSKANAQELLESMSKIQNIVYSAQKIVREQRSKQWLEELAKNDE